MLFIKVQLFWAGKNFLKRENAGCMLRSEVRRKMGENKKNNRHCHKLMNAAAKSRMIMTPNISSPDIVHLICKSSCPSNVSHIAIYQNSSLDLKFK